MISIEETETNPSPSPSAASAPLREPDPPTQNPGTDSCPETSVPPTPADGYSLSLEERVGVRSDPLLTEGPVNSSQDAPDLADNHLNRQSSAENRKSTGKVAHLPKEIRRIVNEMLDDGATYNEIVAKLSELGHPGFFYQNIQRWKNGGYKQWLRAQEQREETIIMAETALELAQHDPNTASHLCEANEILLALKNHKLLQEINDWDAETLLGAEKSKAYFQLSRSITHQLAQRTRRERFKFDVEWKTKKHEAAKQAEQQNGITPMTKEQRAYILDQMDEILGIKLDPADFEDDNDSKTSENQSPGASLERPTPEVPNSGSSLSLTPCFSGVSDAGRPGPRPPAHADTRQNTPSEDSVDAIPHSATPNSGSSLSLTPCFSGVSGAGLPGASPEGHAHTREYTSMSPSDFPPQPIGAKWADFGQP